jgi:hypothetical protein
MSGDAVRTAGRLAGLSSTIRRSVVAAGGAAIRDLEASTPAENGPRPTADVPAAAVDQPMPTLPPAALPSLPDPVASLTPDQRDFLATGAQAILAVNDPAGAPLVTSSLYHWDGAIFRLPGRLSSARAITIDRDPRVSLLIQDRASEAWVAVTGIASLSSVETVEIEMMQILTGYVADDVASGRWAEMRESGEQIVFHVRPTRFVWRPA